MIFAAAIVIALCAVAYRLRGNAFPAGTTSGRILWTAAILAATGNVMSAAGAFIGLLIPHGKWYYMKTVEQWAVIIGIYTVRSFLIGLPGILSIPVGAACAGAHYLGWVFYRRNGTDPLKVAEPIIGAIYGAAILIRTLL